MKDLGYVCLRCRVKLLASSTARTPRRVPLANDQTQAHGRSRTFTSVAHNIPIHTQDRRGSRALHYGPNTGRPQSATQAEHASSIAIFKSIVDSNEIRHEELPTGPAADAGHIYKPMKDAAELNGMLRRDKSVTPAFAFFEKVLYPQLVELGTVPNVVKEGVCRDLVKRLLEEKTRNFGSTDLPTVTRISEVTLKLGILNPAMWGTLMIELLQHISTSSTQPGDYAAIEDYLDAIGRRDALLQDLMGAWTVFSGGESVDSDSAQTGGSLEQDAQITDAVERDDPPNASMRRVRVKVAFQELFRQTHSSSASLASMLRPSIAAVATYQLLKDPVNNKRAIRKSAAPFFGMMNKLLSTTNLPSFKVIEPTLLTYPGLLRYLKWCSSMGPTGRQPTSRPTFASQSRRGMSDSIHRQLGQAIRGRNLTALNKAWVEFWGGSGVPDPDRAKELRKHPMTFDYFVLAYMGMRQPGLAIEVWNRMSQIGIMPTVKTWNSMIQGCANAKNPHGIKTVWQKLVASGTKLDTAIWTARIHGLITSGEPESGLRALEEMVQVWNNRDQEAYAAIAVQPTVEPVNAALTGLLRLERGAAIKNLLAWAAKQGINPDIFTFNTLLRPLVRQGQMDKVNEVFQMMTDFNVNADAATFTILLDSALSNLGSEEPEKQVQLVTKIITQVEATGIEVNMQMYAKVIYLLLEGGDRAEKPVKAVLSHIWGSGLELTSHIFTMLTEHYFSRDPPDSAAVTALIENRRLHNNKDIDRVFWERVIKGYCQVGETDRAHKIFDKVFASGTTITFSTLYEFLLALVNSGDMEAATKLVVTARDINEVDELGKEAGKTRFWKHRFWHLADQYGLMDEKLVASFLAAQSRVGVVE